MPAGQFCIPLQPCLTSAVTASWRSCQYAAMHQSCPTLHFQLKVRSKLHSRHCIYDCRPVNARYAWSQARLMGQLNACRQGWYPWRACWATWHPAKRMRDRTRLLRLPHLQRLGMALVLSGLEWPARKPPLWCASSCGRLSAICPVTICPVNALSW